MTHYQILSVSEHASDSEIKAAYRKLIKQYHPDRNSSAEAREITQQLNEAYDVLSDPQKRRQYDNRFYQAFVTQPVYEEDPREVYRREYIKRKQEERRQAREEELRRKQVIFAYARNVNYVILFLTFVLLLDRYLPSVERGDTLRGISYRATYYQDSTFFFYTNQGLESTAPRNVDLKAMMNTNTSFKISVTKSPLLRIEKEIALEADGTTHRFPPNDIPYATRFLLCWPLLLASVNLAFRREFSESNYKSCRYPRWLFVMQLLLGAITR